MSLKSTIKIFRSEEERIHELSNIETF